MGPYRIELIAAFARRLLILACCLSLPHPCSAAEGIVISSETLIYDGTINTYIARGNVRVEREDVVIEADELIYEEESSNVTASGNIRYADRDVTITARRAEINLETRTGIVYDAELISKKDAYRIAGKEIRKTGANEYASPGARFTTCDAPIPTWCFSGRSVRATIGESMTAKDVVFRIKDIPVLYTPYLWAPILNERKTGFLFPSVGYSDSRGYQLSLPFYWAIAENRDATILFEGYSRRGPGIGIEYRYVHPGDVKGKWWGYYLDDDRRGKTYVEFRAEHEQRSSETLGGYLSVNLVNEKDFYREFKTDLEVRTNRFLESTGELEMPLSNARAYFLSQYWIDLKEEAASPVQKLPEMGYVLHPRRIGPLWLSGSTSASNFWREEGARGQRFDIAPEVTHVFGDSIALLQRLSLRETAYIFDDYERETIHRESLEYRVSGNVRLSKHYASFTHVFEPTLGYALGLLSEERALPTFDATELTKETSLAELAIWNRIVTDHGELIVFRIAEGFDAREGDRPFLPLTFDLGVREPFPLRVSALYDVHDGTVERVTSDVMMQVADITLLAGQRYSRTNDVNTFVAGLGLKPFQRLIVNGKVWYDAELRETREITLNILYTSQCWGLQVTGVKTPDDVSVSFLFELKGITRALKI